MSRQDLEMILLLLATTLLGILAQAARISLNEGETSWRSVIGGLLGAFVVSMVVGSAAIYFWADRVNVFLLIPLCGLAGWGGGELLSWLLKLSKAWGRGKVGLKNEDTK